MDHIQRPIDEYTLAAYIAGTLPEDERAEVAAYLAENADARELLQLAYEALEAARNGDPHLKPAGDFEREVPARLDRSAKQPARFRRVRFPGVIRYAVAATLLIAFGFGIRQAIVMPETGLSAADAYRDAVPETGLEVSVTDEMADLGFRWRPIASADRYRVVIWDLERAEIVGRYQISEARFDQNTPDMADLKPRLEAGHLYAIRIDAIDKQNRILRSSESIEFTPAR